MKKLVNILVLLSLVGLFVPRLCYAQGWTQVAHLGDSEIVSIYFLDQQGTPGVGLVGTQDGKVFRTGDYGQTWQPASVLLPVKGPITSFVFKDASTGWLSCRQLNKPGIYVTHDAGQTWNQLGISTWGNRFDVAYNPFNNRLFMSSPDDNFKYSIDGGVNWNATGPIFLNGIAFSTKLIGVVTCFSGLSHYTHDGGLTWLPSSFPVECWNPLVVAPTVFFAVSEANATTYCTTDGGDVWLPRGKIPVHPTGDVHGLCGQLYVQTDTGFFYSNDEGYSWHALAGPGNVSDTRFYTIGTTIYAGDRHGNVYRVDDEDRAPEGIIAVTSAPDTVIPINTILTTKCGGFDTTIFVKGLTTCETTKLLGYTFDSVRSSTGLTVFQPAGRYRFTDPKTNLFIDLDHASFPYSFNFDDTSFVPLHVVYRPSGTTDSAFVTLHYQIGIFPFDTTIVIYATRDRRVSVQFDNNTILLKAKSACLPERGIFTAMNGKCDSVTIVGVYPADSLHFHIVTKLPATLLPYGSLPIIVSASGDTKDTFYTTIDVVTEVGGVFTHLQVEATLYVPRDGPVTPGIPSNAFVVPTNICARRSYTLPIHNLGCYRMIVEAPHWIITIPELGILSQPTYPDTINPGESDSIVLGFFPDIPQNKTAIIGLNMHSASSNIDTTVQIHSSSYDLSKATLSAAAMEFDSLLICNESEQSVFIRNESCKPTRVTDVLPSTYLDFVSVTPSIGTSIAPGDSIEARVRLKPRTPGDKFDSVTFLFEDSSHAVQSLTVGLHGYVIADVPRITMSDTSIAMMSLDPCSDHDTSVTIKNVSQCDSITIQRADVTGSNWFSSDTKSLPIIIGPNDSARIPIHIQTNSDSTGAASIHIFGTGMDTTLALAAKTAPIVGDEVLATNTGTVFHAKLCSSDMKHFVLQNRTCGPLVIDDLRLTDSIAFGIVSPPAIPLTIPPHGSIQFDILFNADDTTARNASLHYSTSDGKMNRFIPIASLTTTRPQVARLSIISTNGTHTVSRLPGDSLSLAIISDNDVPDSLGLTAVESRLTYDHDLLTLKSATATTGWSNPAPGTDDIRVVSTTNHALTQSAPIAILQFATTFAEPRSTQVEIINPSLNDSDATFAKCVLTASASDSVVVSIAPFCGDSLYGDALLNLPVSMDKVEPMESGGVTDLHVTITAQSSTLCHLSVTDMRGVVVSDLGAYAPHNGVQELHYPIRVSSGVYVLVLESDGRRIGKKFSITK